MSDERDAIDESLRRAFAVPDLSALQVRIEAATRRAPPRATRRWIAVAAIAAAAVAVLVLASRHERVDDVEVARPDDIAARRRAGDQLVALHTKMPTLARPDDGNCLDPAPPDACRGDHPVLAQNDELELLGECGAPGGAPCTDFDVPLARVVQLRDSVGTELLVYIDRGATDPRPLLPEDSALRIFRRELGAYVLYEVTPLDAAVAIDRFAL